MPLQAWTSLEGPDYQKPKFLQRIKGKAESIGRLFTPAGLKAFAIWFLYPAGIPFWKQIFPNNLKAGLTVSLVSLPLSIALAVAAASTPESGVVTAFWAGLTAALTGGSHFNIVGPTGALSSVLASTVEAYPSNQDGGSVLPLVALMSGILAIIAYLLRLERLVMYIPTSVVHGFTLGVAFIIFGGQLRSAFGIHKGYTGHTAFLPYCNCLDDVTGEHYWDFFADSVPVGTAVTSLMPQIGYCSVECSFDNETWGWPYHPGDCSRLNGTARHMPQRKCVNDTAVPPTAYFLSPLELEPPDFCKTEQYGIQSCIVKYDEFILNFVATASAFKFAQPWSVLYFLLNTVVLLSLLGKWPKLPWTILIALIGIVFGVLETYQMIPAGFELTTLREEYPNSGKLSIIGKFSLECTALNQHDCWLLNLGLYRQAVTVCFIGILETLISARIADKMTNTQHDQRREVVGLGIANIVTGVTGGIPATAALARTALNVNSGATSRIAGIISALAILGIAILLFDFFLYIPMPTIACILLMVAVRMVDRHHLKHMWKYDKPMFAVSILTAVTCVVTDTAVGIVVGALVSLMIAADQLAPGYSALSISQGAVPVADPNPARVDHLAYAPPPLTTEKDEGELKTIVPGFHKREDGDHQLIRFDDDRAEEAELVGDTLFYRIVGPLLFINGPGHVRRLKQLIKNGTELKQVVLSLALCYRADLDGVDAIEIMIADIQASGMVAALVRGPHNVGLSIEAQGWYKLLTEEGLTFTSEADVVAAQQQGPLAAVLVPEPVQLLGSSADPVSAAPALSGLSLSSDPSQAQPNPSSLAASTAPAPAPTADEAERRERKPELPEDSSSSSGSGPGQFTGLLDH